MDTKDVKNKTPKSEKIFAVIPKSLKEKVLRYKAKTNMSESEIVNTALNEFFKVKMLKDDSEYIANVIKMAIETQLGKRFERIIALLAKSGKASYSSLFLMAYFLAKVCDNDNNKDFLKEKIDLANKLAYSVVKNKYLDTDISQMIPEDFDFDKLI